MATPFFYYLATLVMQFGGKKEDLFMMKKMVSLLLTAALAVGTLAGCGSAETGAKKDAGSASNGSVFKIGGIGPTTGAAALLMQYGIVEKNDPYLYGEKVRASLIRGARKLPFQQIQPSPLVGWGALCVAESIPRG